VVSTSSKGRRVRGDDSTVGVEDTDEGVRRVENRPEPTPAPFELALSVGSDAHVPEHDDGTAHLVVVADLRHPDLDRNPAGDGRSLGVVHRHIDALVRDLVAERGLGRRAEGSEPRLDVSVEDRVVGADQFLPVGVRHGVESLVDVGYLAGLVHRDHRLVHTLQCVAVHLSGHSPLRTLRG
jgi:hypothetical protein